MQEIVASVKRVTDIMGEISAASEEQSSGIDQVNRAVSQMDEVTQQNAALVEEAAAAAARCRNRRSAWPRRWRCSRSTPARSSRCLPTVFRVSVRPRTAHGCRRPTRLRLNTEASGGDSGNAAPSISVDRQFDFRDADFSRVRKMIHERAGISLGAHKREMVYSRLARRLRAWGGRISPATWTSWSASPTRQSGKTSSMR